MEIMNLNHKIETLEHALEKKKATFAASTEVSVCQSLPRQQSRLLRRSCSKSLNRSVSKQNLSSKQKSNKQVISNQNSLQSKMYRKMLLINSKWDIQFIEDFEQVTRISTQQIQHQIRNLQQFDEQFEQALSQPKLKYSLIFPKIQELQELIALQNEVIGQMKIYQNQLQQIIKNSTQKILELTQQKIMVDVRRSLNENQIQDIVKDIVNALNRWKNSWRNREKRMEEENKQLRDIIQEMILLINKKKQSSTKSCGYRIS